MAEPPQRLLLQRLPASPVSPIRQQCPILYGNDPSRLPRSRNSAVSTFPKLLPGFNVLKTASRKAFENSDEQIGIQFDGGLRHSLQGG
jgi:hypothetical protein